MCRMVQSGDNCEYLLAISTTIKPNQYDFAKRAMIDLVAMMDIG